MTTESNRMSLIKKAHNHGKSGHHHDSSATIRILKTVFKCKVGPSMQKDVKMYIENCLVCKNKRNYVDNAENEVQNWNRVVVEILGPFSKTDCGNEYVGIIVDTTSFWIEGISMKTRSEQELAKFIFDIFIRMGFCSCYLVGVDSSFLDKLRDILKGMCSDLNEHLSVAQNLTTRKSANDSTEIHLENCEEMNSEEQELLVSSCQADDNLITIDVIDILKHEIDSPQSISSVLGKRLNQQMERYILCIKICVHSHPENWDKELDKPLFAMRYYSGSDTKTSPFFTMMQRQPVVLNSRTPRRSCETDNCDFNSGDESVNMYDTKSLECKRKARSKLKDKPVQGPFDKDVQDQEKLNNIAKESLIITKGRVSSPEKDPPEIISPGRLTHYSLRKNVKAKGQSKFVERTVHMASANRTLSQSSAGKKGATCKLTKRPRVNKNENLSHDNNCFVKLIENDDVKNENGSSSNQSVYKVEVIDESEADVIASPSKMSVAMEESNDLVSENNDDEHVPNDGIPREIHVTIVAENHTVKREASSDNENSDSDDYKKRGKLKKRKLAGELPYKCPKCPATYLATLEELNFHLDCHIEGERQLLKCPQCPKTGKSWSLLLRHLLSHDELVDKVRAIPEHRRKCNYCGKIFTTRESMLRHEQVLHKGYSQFECHVCKRQYKERKTFKRHMDLHANIVYKCDHCNYKTKIKRNLTEHSRIHEGKGFTCEICKKVFTKPSILNKHMETHNSRRSSLICDQCGMTLATLGSFRQHVRNMHEKPRVYPCDHCSYVGKSKSNLNGHIDRSHNKPFKCDRCPYCCKSDSTLKRHIDLFHNETERRFACPSCAYRARDPKHLSEHVRFRHNPNALRFPCEFCPMKFKTRTMLRHHLPSHTGQHLYSCQVCGYSAKYRQTVHHHVKVKHIGESVSNVVKGTPCSEIPCTVTDQGETVELLKENEEENCTAFLEEVIITDQQESGLFVAKILRDGKQVDASLLEAGQKGETIAIAGESGIQLHIITGDEDGNNVEMKIVQSEEQTSKAVELLLLAMDPCQTLTEPVTEEITSIVE